MRKVIVVAVREYQAAVKTKAFIISILALPVIWGGMIVAQMLLRNKVDTKDKRIAVLDYSGQVYEAVADAARKRNTEDILEGEGASRRQVGPRYLFSMVEPTTDDIDQARLELSERVRRGEFMAFVVIGPEVVEPGEDPELASVKYHSNSPTYEDIQEWLFGPINDRLRELRIRKLELDPQVVAAATKRVRVQNLGLVSRDEQGNISKAEETNRLANFFVPMGLMMLMLMVVMVSASPLMQSVLEEKTLRIAEVLLGSVPPFQLMMGKLLGMVGVSLTIATIYLVAAFVGIHQAGFGEFFPAQVVWWFIAFQALAVLMFGSLFVAIGAAVSDLKEAQNLMMPVMILVWLPMVVWINVVKEPSSTLALTMSLIPPATPMLIE